MNYTLDQIREQVRALDAEQPWWHDLELGAGIRTRGRSGAELRENHDSVKWSRFRDHLDWTGRTVLDVGCNEGFYGLEAAKRGASRVLGIDIDPLRIKKALFVKQVMKVQNVDFRCADIFSIAHENTEKHDYVFCLGVLHRVPDPFTLIQSVASLGHTVILEWPALEVASADARFWGGGFKNDFYNTGYWQLSRNCVKQILQRCGISTVVDVSPYEKRALFVCTDSESVASKVTSSLQPVKMSSKLNHTWRGFRQCSRHAYLFLRDMVA